MADASPAGFGVVYTSWQERDVRSVGVYNERWRFSLDYVQGKGARAAALGLADPLRDMTTVKPVRVPPSWQWKELLTFPEVPAELLRDSAWTTALARPWQREEDIHVFEAAACVAFRVLRFT